MSATTAFHAFRRAIAHWGRREYGALILLWSVTAAVPYVVWGWGLFSLFVFPLTLASIPLITVVVERLLPRAPAASAGRQHVIEFYTVVGEEERHGKLTYVDRAGRIMWNIAGSSPRTVDAPLTDAAFRVIWDGLRSIGDFQSFKTNDSVESLDLTANYFVGMAFTDGGQTYMGKFLVPHGCTSPKVSAWIEEFMETRRAAA